MNKVGGLVTTLTLVCCVAADYQLSVTIYSYSNPENKCAACRDLPLEPFGCCDNHALKNATECAERQRPCEIVLSVCLRQPSSRVNAALCPDGINLHSSAVLQVSTFNPPLKITSEGTVFDKVNSQLYITLNDDDFRSGTELVDSFPTNLTVGTRVGKGVMRGQFGLATIELELSLVCTGNTFGPDCSSDVCNPDLTGEFCETNINDCESVDCSGRGMCKDGVNSYSCACETGYSGANCEVHIGGVAGGVTAAVLVVVVFAVLIIIIISVYSKQRKDINTNEVEESEYQLNSGFEERELDNPIYGADGINEKEDIKESEYQLNSGSEERELDNPIYGADGINEKEDISL